MKHPSRIRSARRRPPRKLSRSLRRHRRTVAIVVSIVAHLVFGFIFLHHRAETSTETVATSQHITFERKRAPRPTPIPRPKTPPVLHVQPIPRPLPLPVPAPLARARLVPLRVAPPATIARASHPQSRRKELAKPAPHAPAVEPVARPTLGDARIAQITNDLRDAIAGDVARRQSALAVAPAPIAPPRHYALDASNFISGDRRSHGLCDPIQNWAAGEYNYYYVACNVKFSDGTYQRQSVPWPVRFRRDDDPFAGSGREKPLAMPLPGWTLPAGETVSPELRAYAREHGVTIDG